MYTDFHNYWGWEQHVEREVVPSFHLTEITSGFGLLQVPNGFQLVFEGLIKMHSVWTKDLLAVWTKIVTIFDKVSETTEK